MAVRACWCHACGADLTAKKTVVERKMGRQGVRKFLQMLAPPRFSVSITEPRERRRTNGTIAPRLIRARVVWFCSGCESVAADILMMLNNLPFKDHPGTQS